MWIEFWKNIPEIIKESSKSELAIVSLIVILAFVAVILIIPKDSFFRKTLSLIFTLFIVLAGGAFVYKIIFLPSGDSTASNKEPIPSMSVYVWDEATKKTIPNAVISMRRANGDSAPLFNGSQPHYDSRNNYYVYKSLLGSLGEKVIISVSADGYKDDEDPYGLGETAKFPLKKVFE